jgi:hypothetical protein
MLSSVQPLRKNFDGLVARLANNNQVDLLAEVGKKVVVYEALALLGTVRAQWKKAIGVMPF